jgi:hypothetical protein
MAKELTKRSVRHSIHKAVIRQEVEAFKSLSDLLEKIQNQKYAINKKFQPSGI